MIVPNGNYIHDFYWCRPFVLNNDNVDMFNRTQLDLCPTEYIDTVTFKVRTFNVWFGQPKPIHKFVPDNKSYLFTITFTQSGSSLWLVGHLLREHLLIEHLLTEHLLTEHLLTKHLLTEHPLTEHLLTEHLLTEHRYLILLHIWQTWYSLLVLTDNVSRTSDNTSYASLCIHPHLVEFSG